MSFWADRRPRAIVATIAITAAFTAHTEAQASPVDNPVALLASIGIALVPVIDFADGCRGRYALACVTAGEPVIHLTREALRLDAREVAAILAHERLHVLGELHEGPAYDEELRVLKLLHGPSEAFARVRAGHELHRFDYPTGLKR